LDERVGSVSVSQQGNAPQAHPDFYTDALDLPQAIDPQEKHTGFIGVSDGFRTRRTPK
jgi:hypothetical protein